MTDAALRQLLPASLSEAGRHVAENWARDVAENWARDAARRMRYMHQVMDSDEEGREENRELDHVDLWGEEDDSDEEVIPESLDTHALAQPRPTPPPRTAVGTHPLYVGHDLTPPSALHELVCRFIDSENDAKSNKDERPHNEFLCPLSLHAMRDPVCCEDGCLYERTHIEQALLVSSRSPINRKGMTGVMVPCKPMITMMENWVRSKLPPLAEGTMESMLRITLDVPEDPKDVD